VARSGSGAVEPGFILVDVGVLAHASNTMSTCFCELKSALTWLRRKSEG